MEGDSNNKLDAQNIQAIFQTDGKVSLVIARLFYYEICFLFLKKVSYSVSMEEKNHWNYVC